MARGLIFVLGAFFFLAAAATARAVHFAFFYRVFPDESACAEIPSGSTLLALGFEYLGEENGVIQPGAGNIELASQVARCADRLSLVVTQKAISDALEQKGLLSDGKLLGRVPVLQMHPHRPSAPVRTFQALEFALEGLQPLPDSLVLLAHDKQIERAYADLSALYSGRIVLWKINGVAYSRPGWVQPLRWAFRELYLARPAEFFIRAVKTHNLLKTC